MIYEVRDELISMLISIAPDYQQLLKPSSTEEAIRNLEEALEVALPRDYREFLKSHNGSHREKLLIAFSLFGVDVNRIENETTSRRSQGILTKLRGWWLG